jgi:hypothetical protein
MGLPGAGFLGMAVIVTFGVKMDRQESPMGFTQDMDHASRVGARKRQGRPDNTKRIDAEQGCGPPVPKSAF